MNLTIAVTTAFIASSAGNAAVAGFGTGTRLEFLLPPLAFGIGAPMVALVGSNIGARQPARALRIALIGGALAFALTEILGVTAALAPETWLRLFDNEPEVLAAGSAYLRIVGPVFGIYGLGLSLYFASQGAQRLGWPLFAGLLRVVITIGGGWLALRLTRSLDCLFAVYAGALVVYGAVIAAAVGSGSWFRKARP
jgi:Na+-driven multidrug efflux pump